MQYTACTISFSSNNVVSESINEITMITNLSQTEELFPKYTLVQSMRELINGMLKKLRRAKLRAHRKGNKSWKLFSTLLKQELHRFTVD